MTTTTILLPKIERDNSDPTGLTRQQNGLMPSLKLCELSTPSKLLSKRKNRVLSIKTTKSTNSGKKKLNFSTMIQDMKKSCAENSASPKRHNGFRSPGSDIEYVFAKSKISGRSLQEKSISNALDTIGIFQINLGVVMKDYCSISSL
ncbi:unnamed protein product [Moneuplotes crassus]|uniref:Uncharacterized protein n=1 Tax=Euplotes crassus TaxID=5936 RepID=A0AAD1XSZ3_EUPCR|nr:unnamed protein product [Moneuplotes crassus]